MLLLSTQGFFWSLRGFWDIRGPGYLPLGHPQQSLAGQTSVLADRLIPVALKWVSKAAQHSCVKHHLYFIIPVFCAALVMVMYAKGGDSESSRVERIEYKRTE